MTIEQKRMSQMGDTVQQLLLYDPIILNGEIIIEQDSNQMKIGTNAAERYSQLDYFNPATLKITPIAGTTLSTSAALCGSLIRVENASDFELTLLSGDLSQATTPVGITSHFPEGGFFYVMFDHDTSASTTFEVTAGPDNTFNANEFGQSISKAASASLDLNGGGPCHGKLYLFICLPAGVWQIYETDLKDVWEEAKVALLAHPSYGGANLGVIDNLGAGQRTIVYNTEMESNAGVDTSDFLNGIITIKTAGDYWVKATLTFFTASITPNYLLRIKRNGATLPGNQGTLEFGGTWPSTFTTMAVDTIVRLEVDDDMILTIAGTGGGDTNIVQFSQFMFQKLDIRTDT